MTDFQQEIRQALRFVTRGRGLSLAVVLILALGIGAASTFFSFLDAAFLRPLPYAVPERLVAVGTARAMHADAGPVASGTLAALREATAAFEGVEGYRPVRLRLSANGSVHHVRGVVGTVGLLALLGTDPLLGRLPVPGDTAANHVVLSHSFWRESFGASPSVVGETVTVNGQPLRVAAVMPRGFGFPHAERVWLLSPALLSGDRAASLYAIARLRPGASVPSARSELDAWSAGAHSASENPDARLRLGRDVVDRTGFGPLPWLLFAVGILLLVLVSTNVASLLTVWHVRRRGELAVRSALGAGRAQLLRQTLMECVLFALCGGALGLLVAAGGAAALPHVIGGNLPEWLEPRLDTRVVGFASAVSLGSVLLFGLLPSLRSSRASIADVMRGRARTYTPGVGEHRLRARLIGAQVAISTLLLAGTVLLLDTARGLSGVDPGFPAHEILALTFQWSDADRAEPAAVTGRVERYRAGVATLDGVTTASFEGGLGGMRSSAPESGPGSAPPEPLDVRPFVDGRRLGLRSTTRVVGPDYLRAVGLDIVEGRDFDAGDVAGAPLVALVPRSVAARAWPGTSAIGRTLSLGADGPAVRVIGVVADRNEILSGRAGIRVAPVEDIFLSAAQMHVRDPSLLVRARGAPMRMLPAIQERLLSTDPAASVSRAATLAERFHLTTALSWSFGRLFLFFAATGLAISSIGLFGLIAQLVTERRREIGIRLALGAEPRSLVRALVARGMRTAVTGALIGILLSLGAAPLLTIFVYRARIFDPLNLTLVVGAVIGVAGAASLLPARRAATVRPAEVLGVD